MHWIQVKACLHSVILSQFTIFIINILEERIKSWNQVTVSGFSLGGVDSVGVNRHQQCEEFSCSPEFLGAPLNVAVIQCQYLHLLLPSGQIRPTLWRHFVPPHLNNCITVKNYLCTTSGFLRFRFPVFFHALISPRHSTISLSCASSHQCDVGANLVS